MSNTKTIDYLFEDPPLTNQKFALVSIVGPHMPQKCDIWGLKIRGTADTLEKAKSMSQKLLKIDNNYDIYTVEVGKFFPLAVEPNQISDIEYQNTQLNQLVKSYLENRELANEQWHARKNEMIKEAIREGKEQSSSKPEHPIAVLQRIKNFEKDVSDIQETLQNMKNDLQLSKEKFNNYTEEERALAQQELSSALQQTVSENENSNANIEELKEELSGGLENTNSNTVVNTQIENIIKQLKIEEDELDELEELKSSINATNSPNVYAKVVKNIESTKQTITELKEKLNDNNLINEYINSNYGESEYSYLTNNTQRDTE